MHQYFNYHLLHISLIPVFNNIKIYMIDDQSKMSLKSTFFVFKNKNPRNQNFCQSASRRFYFKHAKFKIKYSLTNLQNILNKLFYKQT